MVEQLLCKQTAAGSSPVTSTTNCRLWRKTGVASPAPHHSGEIDEPWKNRVAPVGISRKAKAVRSSRERRALKLRVGLHPFMASCRSGLTAPF